MKLHWFLFVVLFWVNCPNSYSQNPEGALTDEETISQLQHFCFSAVINNTTAPLNESPCEKNEERDLEEDNDKEEEEDKETALKAVSARFSAYHHSLYLFVDYSYPYPYCARVSDCLIPAAEADRMHYTYLRLHRLKIMADIA